jgi:hypothetical protein
MADPGIGQANPARGGTALGQTSYTKQSTDGLPDAVVDYIVPASQYSNKTPYGMNPNRMLEGQVISLGNFGGYVTAYYADGIKNDPKHKFGVDFTVYGNSLGSAFSEPGNVYVSEDGKQFYLLAGSDYFEDHTIRDYQVTYTKDADGNSDWADNQGKSDDPGTSYRFPLPENYPLFQWPSDVNSLTFSGPFLVGDLAKPNTSASAAFPDWGYADVHTPTGPTSTEPGNPYRNVDTLMKSGGYGDGFDLDWAVDERGKPVALDEIHYIKVSTASHIYAGAIGEKSTEVSAIQAAPEAAAQVGRSSAPTAIKVNGKALTLDANAEVTVDLDAQLDVQVEGAPENVYIGGVKGASRTFSKAPLSRTLRVVVQNGDREPVIYNIALKAPGTENPGGGDNPGQGDKPDGGDNPNPGDKPSGGSQSGGGQPNSGNSSHSGANPSVPSQNNGNAIPSSAPTVQPAEENSPQPKTKAKPTLKLKLAKSVKAKQRAKLTLRVAAAKNVKASVKIRILDKNGKRVKTLTVKIGKSGNASVKLPKLAKGKYTISVQYPGNKSVKGKSAKLKLNVV